MEQKHSLNAERLMRRANRICDDCGGLLYRNDEWLPEYAGFDYCGCAHSTYFKQVCEERNQMLIEAWERWRTPSNSSHDLNT